MIASTVLLQLKIYIDISRGISQFASPWREGGLSHFSEGLYSRDLGQIGILGGNWHFGSGWCFSGGTWALPTYIKNSEYESQTNKKNDSDCYCYHFSLLVPYPNNFLIVCLCILIFHGIYLPPTHKYFFCGAKKFFHILWLGAVKISNFLGTFCIEGN